jgi:hypothetical protein
LAVEQNNRLGRHEGFSPLATLPRVETDQKRNRYRVGNRIENPSPNSILCSPIWQATEVPRSSGFFSPPATMSDQVIEVQAAVAGMVDVPSDSTAATAKAVPML